MSYHWETVDAHALIRKAFDICRSGLNAKRRRTEVDLGAARHHVKADPARLQQVIWNLLKNAAKFTPDGGTVAVRTRDRGGRLTVEVSDTGIGIDAAALTRVFNAFEQAEDPRAHK